MVDWDTPPVAQAFDVLADDFWSSSFPKSRGTAWLEKEDAIMAKEPSAMGAISVIASLRKRERNKRFSSFLRSARLDDSSLGDMFVCRL
jgi:hypothetical protein